MHAGLKPSQEKRPTPLNVMGVGNGAQTCEYDACVPLALERTDGTFVKADYTAPIVENSELPMLMGLDTLREQRAILDLHSLQLHFCGPGDTKLDLPPGSDSFQLELSPSGHLVLPCGRYEEAKASTQKIQEAEEYHRPTLNLHSAETTSVIPQGAKL